MPVSSETLTVTGQAPLIETTQSKVANTIETTELQNLPMITRTISGMLELLPGAAPVAPLHRTKENVGTVSYGGSSGGNVAMNVDGADNRDNHYSGPLLTFTTESLEQFQLASSQFTAADGRTGGAAVTLVTKSGTNLLHGSAFGYERDQKLTAKDFFTKAGERREAAVQPAAVWRIHRRADHPEPDVLLRRDRAAARGRRQVRP